MRTNRGKLFAFCLLLAFGVAACQPLGQPNANSRQSTGRRESRLTLTKATLEQANAKGEPLWKIQVETAVYSPDRQKAQLSQIKGNLFQDGQLVLQISADKGEIVRDGTDIFLKENIIATDPRNGTTIRSQEVEWRPQQNLLLVRQQLNGSHPKLVASAQEGKYNTQEQRLELVGNIVATSKQPRLQLKTEHLLWKVPQDKLVGDRPLTIVRYQGQTITDRLVTRRSEVDLKTNSVFIQDNIEFRSLEPPLQMATNAVRWNYKDRIVTSNQPIKLFHSRDRLTITGNQAVVDLTKKVAYLKGGVAGTSERNQAKLYANELTWHMPTQVVEAAGNVTYEQKAKPQASLKGERAIGRLQDNSVVVSGGSGGRVVTEIVPE